MIFISYSRDDIKWKNIIVRKLKAICEQQQVNGEHLFWHDSNIKGSDNWKETIFKARALAKSVIFLYSESFLASDFIPVEEYQYFLNRRNEVDIFWFVVDQINYEKSQLYSYNIQACTFTDNRIKPLEDIESPKELQRFLLDSLDDIVEKYKTKNFDVISANNIFSEISIPDIENYILDNRVYLCNRAIETNIFEQSFFLYQDICPYLCFAIDGGTDDLLDTLSESILLKSISKYYAASRVELIRLNSTFRITSANVHDQTIILRNLKLEILKQLRLPIDIKNPLKLSDFPKPILEADFLIFEFKVNSSYFNKVVCDCIIDWIHSELMADSSIQGPKALFFFIFEKNGTEEENRHMSEYISQKVCDANFYDLIYNVGLSLPMEFENKNIIYLGTHKDVFKDDIEIWFAENTKFNKVFFDRFFDMKYSERIKMKHAVNMIQKFIRKHNQYLLNQ